MELSVKDWDVVCQAFQRLCGSVGAEKPNHAGEPWTEELDRLLAKKWAEGETVAKIALAMGRTNGSIASRLERLDIVADRAEASRRK
ncbi:MAG: hypothetical protein KDE15_15155 [Erythrobacter sp.]|nr:hypothetical protein [Erythrobacter sp.]